MMKKDTAYVVDRKFILAWDAYTKSNCIQNSSDYPALVVLITRISLFTKKLEIISLD